MAQHIVIDRVSKRFPPAKRGGDEIVAPINALMREYDSVVLTQDWHPADHSSFAASHPGVEPYSTVQMPYGPQVLWPSHCVIGTGGAAVRRPDASAPGCRLHKNAG